MIRHRDAALLMAAVAASSRARAQMMGKHIVDKGDLKTSCPVKEVPIDRDTLISSGVEEAEPCVTMI
jgi:hypothetical protein